MDTVFSFLIIGENPSIYDQLRKANLSPDIRLFFCGRGENVTGFVQTNEIRSILLDAGEGPEECRGLIRELKTFDPLLQVAVTGPPAPPEEILRWVDGGALDYFPQPIEP